jgi:hypothetical protein
MIRSVTLRYPTLRDSAIAALGGGTYRAVFSIASLAACDCIYPQQLARDEGGSC